MTSDTPARDAPFADRYHHGDLANVLRAAAADLLAERGVAGFSLREVARRAGVSHAAPAHHFVDAQGLLTAVAIEGLQHLAGETEAAVTGIEDPVEALAQLGRAYVSGAITYPGHCAIVFRGDAVDTNDPEYQEWAQRAFGVLESTVARLAREQAPDLDVALGSALCWSTVQGLITVHHPLQAMAARNGRTVAPIEDLAEQLTRLIVTGLVG